MYNTVKYNNLHIDTVSVFILDYFCYSPVGVWPCMVIVDGLQKTKVKTSTV